MRLLVQMMMALAIACTALPAVAQDKVRVLLDWFVNPDHAALVIAKQKGVFSKHGLDVELIAPADPNAPPSWWRRARPTMPCRTSRRCRCWWPKVCLW